MAQIHRRDILKSVGGPLAQRLKGASTHPRKVIVAGGGIAGLSCAWELLRRGHDPVVLEAAGRPGGHVFTLRDTFADGLYADVGAEHFTKPGYDLYWAYVNEFNLPILKYPRREHVIRRIGEQLYSEEMLADPAILRRFSLNQREVDYLARHDWSQFQSLYLKPYTDGFVDEYTPFDAGLNHLDRITVTDLLEKDGASAAAIGLIGGSHSALWAVWLDAIMKLRGIPLQPRDLYRLQGGNQILTDTLAAKLGDRVRLGCPVTAIRRGDTAVEVTYREFGRERTMEADFLVCSLSAVMLRQIPVTPDWPEHHKYAIGNVPYHTVARVVLQSRTAFWNQDGISPNLTLGLPALHHVWRTADEVRTRRGLLMGAAQPGTTAASALAGFRKYYPGKSENIEHGLVWDWSRDPWAMACETIAFQPGELPKLWPYVTEPCGRIYFAGAWCDNLNHGQDAATRSAHRVAGQIDRFSSS